MQVHPFVVSKQSYRPALDVLGVQVTVLASNDATQVYEITLQGGPEGSGPQPHSDPWEESFYVLGGRVEFTCDGRASSCEAGTLVHVPAGTVHSFRFAAGGGNMLEITGAGGGATRMFENVAKNVPPGPPDVPKLIALLGQHGVSVAL